MGSCKAELTSLAELEPLKEIGIVALNSQAYREVI